MKQESSFSKFKDTMNRLVFWWSKTRYYISSIYIRGVTAAPKTAVRYRLNFGLSLIAQTAILGAAIAN